MTTKITAVGYPATLDLAGLIALAITKPYKPARVDGALAEVNKIAGDQLITIWISGMLTRAEIEEAKAKIQSDPHIARVIDGWADSGLGRTVVDAVICKSALAEVSDAPKITTGFDEREQKFFAEARWANTGIPRDLVRATRFGETLEEATAKLSRDFGLAVAA